MKKFYFLSFALCMFLFTACSDDDKEENWAEKISKEYSGNDLSLSINDVEDTYKAVKFLTSDLEKGNLTLINMFPGESEIALNNLTLTQDETNDKLYHFIGESKNTNREITITGTVGNGMELDVKFKIVSPIVNSWKTYGFLSAQSSLTLDITPLESDSKINMNGVLGKEDVLLVGGNLLNQSFDLLISGLARTVFGTLVTLELEMNDNGNMIAKWSPGIGGGVLNITEGQSKEGVVKYNIVENQIYVTVDITDLISGMLTGSGNIDVSQLPSGILELIPVITQDGLPLNIKIDENSLTANVTKEMMVPYLDLINALVDLLIKDVEFPEAMDEFGLSSENLPPFLLEVSRVIKESPKFDLNINLSRVEKSAAE